MKGLLKRFVITVRGKRVVSFDECSEKRQPLVSEIDGRIVFREDTQDRKEVASFPRAHFDSAHAALSWVYFLSRRDWFTSFHLWRLLHLLGVGLPTVEGVCDPAQTPCTPLPPDDLKSKGKAA